MFYRPVHLAPIFLFLQGLTLVVFLLTLAEGNVHLRPTLVVDKHEDRHDSIARLLRGTLQLPYLPPRQEQLTVALHLVIVVRAVEVWADIHPFDPQLAVDHGAVGIHQTRLAETDALDLRPREHDTGSKGLDEEIFKRSLLILDLYWALLPQQFLFFIHYSLFSTWILRISWTQSLSSV